MKKADDALRVEGMKLLIEGLGVVDTGRFINCVKKERFDYTEWQRGLWKGKSVEEIMDINAEKKKLLDIYNKTSNMNLYKNASKKEKFLLFILPIILTLILLFFCWVFKNSPVSLISFPLLFFIFYISGKRYDNYIKNKYCLPKNQNDNIYYRTFIKDLKAEGIKGKKIKYYIDLLGLDNNSDQNNKISFYSYFTLIYIPALMVYFNDAFIDAKIIAYLTLGLFFVPVFVFLFKAYFGIKKRKYDMILQFLKRRSIELKYKR
ncbi:MAG: hypothetical protein LBI28_15005 [Treponema sp.]|nr:hypothetical protein [Treponema sp.]